MTLTLPQAMQRAVAAYQQGEWGEAERLCRLIVNAQSNNLGAMNMLGVITARTGRTQEAVDLLSRVVAANPREAAAHCNLGNVLRSLQRHAQALESYGRAIALKPDYAEAYNNRGIALVDLKRPADALESYERAIALKPDYAEAYNNRGIALADLGRHADALESYARALAFKPDYAEAHNNRGIVLVDIGRHAEALESYARALALMPDYASAHFNLALCRLLLGDFALGWEEYEWRSKEEQLAIPKRDFTQPLWLGEPALQGKTILLHAEQGLGDTLQFCRYARLVAELGAKVVLEVQSPLLPLLADLEGVSQVMPNGTSLPAFDYHCPLLTLPRAFRTAVSSIPANIPYVHGDAARVRAWQGKLGKENKPRVGLVWSGSTTLKNDRNRSMALAQMLPLVCDRAEYVSLQKEVRETDAGVLASRRDIRHFGDELKDFSDTAALVELMDVVVTVDTSVAHLAGAMGKAVWVLLPFNPDWRWMLDRDDSVWYPTARLFRQPAMGDWASAIRRLREELDRRFGAPC